MSPRVFRLFMLKKMPIAYIAGLRLRQISKEKATIGVKLGWFNQNPFRSMFWAVQGMAAELSTGVMCMAKIKSSNQSVSMLVVEQKAEFTKKAVGKIQFTCRQGNAIDECLRKIIENKGSDTLWLESIGIDEAGDQVAKFQFHWSFKVR